MHLYLVVSLVTLANKRPLFVFFLCTVHCVKIRWFICASVMRLKMRHIAEFQTETSYCKTFDIFTFMAEWNEIYIFFCNFGPTVLQIYKPNQENDRKVHPSVVIPRAASAGAELNPWRLIKSPTDKCTLSFSLMENDPTVRRLPWGYKDIWQCLLCFTNALAACV